MKKRKLSVLDRKTEYTTCMRPPHIILKTLNQIGYPEICKYNERQAKMMLKKLGLLPVRQLKDRVCYRCGSEMRRDGRSEAAIICSKSERCQDSQS